MISERTDRELLELAAKAAGIEHGADRIDSGLSLTDGGHFPKWNPLDDDGDALRLLAALGLEVMWHRDGRVAAFCGDPASSTVWESRRENRQGNLRRAIVRAAAAMAEGGEHG